MHSSHPLALGLASLQLEALQAQLEAAEQESRELRREVEQLRALGVQQVGPGPGHGLWQQCTLESARALAGAGRVCSPVLNNFKGLMGQCSSEQLVGGSR